MSSKHFRQREHFPVVKEHFEVYKCSKFEDFELMSKKLGKETYLAVCIREYTAN